MNKYFVQHPSPYFEIYKNPKLSIYDYSEIEFETILLPIQYLARYVLYDQKDLHDFSEEGRRYVHKREQHWNIGLISYYLNPDNCTIYFADKVEWRWLKRYNHYDFYGKFLGSFVFAEGQGFLGFHQPVIDYDTIYKEIINGQRNKKLSL